jgi:DNA-binding transcriptional regulator LsrR (DeoR family)
LPSAEDLARLADAGQDVSQFFTNRGRMMTPIQRVNVDFAAPMLAELDRIAESLNVSRQAVIKSLLRQALDRHHVSALITDAHLNESQRQRLQELLKG